MENIGEPRDISRIEVMMVLESWCIARVSFQVFCDLWNECWQFGVTRGALCILRSTCSATSAILIHSELHFGQ